MQMGDFLSATHQQLKAVQYTQVHISTFFYFFGFVLKDSAARSKKESADSGIKVPCSSVKVLIMQQQQRDGHLHLLLLIPCYY